MTSGVFQRLRVSKGTDTNQIKMDVQMADAISPMGKLLYRVICIDG